MSRDQTLNITGADENPKTKVLTTNTNKSPTVARLMRID
jgi:hypothetical protein